MTFRSVLDIDCGIRYLYDSLPLSSSAARRLLLESEAMTSKRDIDLRYSKLNALYTKKCAEIAGRLLSLKDITATIKRVAGGAVLEDIELFEIKHLAIVNRQIMQMLERERINVVNLPDLNDVMEILDPDSLNVPSFYIYDSYSAGLARIRREMKAITRHSSRKLTEEQMAALAQLQQQNDLLEQEVRIELAARLKDKAGKLEHTLKNLALLDIMIAVVTQMKELGLCFPVTVEGGETFYCQMFNPMVKAAVEQRGGVYTPVDISFAKIPVTITGANMGGKSVVLKTLALNQIAVQFGLGAAARSCCVNIVENILFSNGDDGNGEKGFSSFAAEMLVINRIVESAKRGENLLALLDEPARATNPIEGAALVEGLLDVLASAKGGVIVATHYNIKNEKIKRYRVAGLKEGGMDYTLVETGSGDVPHEAIAVAERLGVNKEWLELTKKHLN